MKKIFLTLLLNLLVLTGCSNKEVNKKTQIIENNGMLSYTIDGEKTDIKPTKEDGYIVNKIICDSGSDMMWDNDNWEVELTKINSKDSCKMDFTKDTSEEGYRVTVTSNLPESLDSLSKATTENGTVKIYSKAKIESVTGCQGIIEDNKVIVSNVNSNQACKIIIEDKTLAGIIKIAYNADDTRVRTDFSVIDNGTHADTPTGVTGGLYAAKDDQGTTYYFSGDGTNMNNWVKFADKLWRIIRINGNGSVRLLYAGDGNDATDIGSSAFNSTRTHPQYVGWKYTSGDSLNTNRQNGTKSTIYIVVETWYNGLSITNKNYIDTSAIYCNDRGDNGNYSTNSIFHYITYNRVSYNPPNPSFVCNNSNDSFPRKSENGNLLDIPVGLMTVDEVAYAGGKAGSTSPKAYYYLNLKASEGNISCTYKSGDPCSITGEDGWWTMSPCNYSSFDSNNRAGTYNVQGSLESGKMTYNRVNLNLNIRPVISLKSEVQVTGGDGSGNNPYTVKMP